MCLCVFKCVYICVGTKRATECPACWELNLRTLKEPDAWASSIPNGLIKSDMWLRFHTLQDFSCWFAIGWKISDLVCGLYNLFFLLAVTNTHQKQLKKEDLLWLIIWEKFIMVKKPRWQELRIAFHIATIKEAKEMDADIQLAFFFLFSLDFQSM